MLLRRDYAFREYQHARDGTLIRCQLQPPNITLIRHRYARGHQILNNSFDIATDDYFAIDIFFFHYLLSHYFTFIIFILIFFIEFR